MIDLASSCESLDNGSCLIPSDAILKCNGQDISRKGGKSKSLMIVLPAELSFLKNSDGDFAYLENLNSAQPELVIEVEGGALRFKGKFVETRSAFLSIDLQPTKKQSVCNDLTTRILVFDPPIYSTATVAAVAKIGEGTPTETGESGPHLATTKDGEEVGSWLQHFGCSVAAQPRLVKCSASQRSRLSTTVSGSSLSQPSQRSTSVGEGEKQKKTGRSLKHAVHTVDDDSEQEKQVEEQSDEDGEEGGLRGGGRKGGGASMSRKRAGDANGSAKRRGGADDVSEAMARRSGARKRGRVSYVESISGESDREDDSEDDEQSQDSSWDDE